MRVMMLIALVIVLVVPSVAVAQESEDYPACELVPTRDVLVGLLQDVSTWEEFEAFANDIDVSLKWCQDSTNASVIAGQNNAPTPSNLVFTGTGDEVVGPVDIPAGVYLWRIIGEGTSVDFTFVSGEPRGCEFVFNFVEPGQQSSEETLSVQGCSALLEVDSSTAWQIEFDVVQANRTTPDDAEDMWRAYFAGNFPLANSYLCQESREEDDSVFQGIDLVSVSCWNDGSDVSCSVTASSDDETGTIIQRVIVEGGVFCGFQSLN